MKSVIEWSQAGGPAMDRLAQLIEETTDVRELKRAVSVKLGEEGMATDAIGAVLQVTPRAVRKWRRRYEREGVEGLHVRTRGSESYLSVEQRQELAEWVGAQETLTLEEKCHLVWGDVCGMAWGKRNAPIVVPMTKERERQTYYGALNLLTQEFH